MPYADPEKRKAVKRESNRRARAKQAGERTERVLAEVASDVPRVLPDPPARDELLRLLGLQARSGSVRAIELLLKTEAVEDSSDEFSEFDELAGRRAGR